MDRGTRLGVGSGVEVGLGATCGGGVAVRVAVGGPVGVGGFGVDVGGLVGVGGYDVDVGCGSIAGPGEKAVDIDVGIAVPVWVGTAVDVDDATQSGSDAIVVQAAA